MSAQVAPGTTAGGFYQGVVRPRPTRREVEALLHLEFPNLSPSAANRSARRAMKADDPYQAARDDVLRRISAGEFYNALGYVDPTGNRAVANVMRGRVA